MRKKEEIADPNSCLNRAADDEILFVLRSKDATAPMVIRFWVEARIQMGLNRFDDPKLTEALVCANRMDTERIAMEKKV